MRVAITISPGDQSTRLTNRIAAQAARGSHPGRLRDTNSVCQNSQQATIQGIALGKVNREARTKKVRRTVTDTFQLIDKSRCFGTSGLPGRSSRIP